MKAINPQWPPARATLTEIPLPDDLPLSTLSLVSETDAVHPPAPPLEYETRQGKVWVAGTLTYALGGLVVLFCWLLFGDFALSLRERSVGPIVQLFVKRQGVSDFTMALLLSSLPPLLGMVIGPIVAYRSDRLRSRWGRRIPYLIIPTPIAALAMVGIAFSPAMGNAVHELLGGRLAPNTCTIGVFTIFWTIFEVAVIVSGSVFGGLINDVVPRPVLGRFFGLFRAVSLLDGMFFNYVLIQHAEAHFFGLFIGVAAVFGVGFVLMCLKVKEGDYPPVPPEQPADLLIVQRPGFLNALAAYFHNFFNAAGIYFRECYSKPYYLCCFAAFTLGAITFLPINLFSIPYAQHLNIDMAFYGKQIANSYVISLCLALPLGWLVDRFHPVRVSMYALVIYACSTAWGAWGIHDTRTFGIALILHTVLSGTYFTAAASLGQALLPRSKYSQFSTAGGLISSSIQIALGPLLGLLLDRTDHNYRLVFVIGFALSCLAVLTMAVVFRNFMRLGGPGNYVAPGDTPADIAAPITPAATH